MAGEYTLSVLLTAQNQASSILSGFMGQLGGVGTALFGLGAAALGVGVASVKMAGDFQQGVTSLVTGAGESQKNVGMISQALLDMSVQTATSTTDLTNGLYMIASAGYHGASGLQVLKAAAMGAKVGNADLATVSDALTTAMTDYNIPASKATDVTNLLIATVANGKTHMSDLASSLSVILPTSAAAGVGINQVAGAMATMTGEGVPARQAAQNLKMAIMALDAPSTSAQKEFKLLGLSSSEIATRMKTDLPGALKEITDAIGKKFPAGSAGYMAALKAIMGGNNQMQAILDLTGTHLNTFKGNVHGVASAVSSGKGQINGWAAVQQTFNFQMQQAQMAANKLMIELGTALMPAVLGLMNGIQNVITTGQRFIGWLSGSSAGAIAVKALLIALAGALVALAITAIPPLVVALGASAVAAWANAIAFLAMEWPILLIGAVIALVVVGIILAIQHWGQIVAWLKGVWNAFSSWFGGVMSAIGTFFHNVWNGIVNFFVGIWNNIVNFARQHFLQILAVITGPIGAIVIFIVTHWNQIVSFLTGVWNNIKLMAQTTWNNIVGVFQSVWGRISSVLSNLWNNIKNWFANLATQAVQWGVNLIQGFINGIGSMINNVKNAAGNVVNAVKNMLGFHSPAKEGPGQDADTWAPNFMKMYTQGVINGLPALITAISLAASTLNPTHNANVSLTGSAGALLGSQGKGQTVNAPIILTVNGSVVDHSKLLKEISQLQDKQMRQQGYHVAIRSGGRTQ